jgi:hypothetical protein
MEINKYLDEHVFDQRENDELVVFNAVHLVLDESAQPVAHADRSNGLCKSLRILRDLRKRY